MPTDEELQLVTISDNIFNREQYTQFEIIPPPAISRIGTIADASTSLTVNSGSGISIGLYVYANGLRSGTSVTNVVGNVVTLSLPSTEAFTYRNIIFYTDFQEGLLPLKPGQTIKFS